MNQRDHARDAYVVSAIDGGLRGADVAAVLGITRERVRQLYKRATGRGLIEHGVICRTCGERYHGAWGDHANDPSHQSAVAGRRQRAASARGVERTARWLSLIDTSAGPDGCWPWLGKMFPNGYGDTRYRAERYAHRWSYSHFVGPIPEGLTLDHLCRTTRCINPRHLEPVTHRENILRSPIAPAAINARKTHCKWGHSLADARRSSDGRRRQCRVCSAEWERNSRARRAALRAAA